MRLEFARARCACRPVQTEAHYRKRMYDQETLKTRRKPGEIRPRPHDQAVAAGGHVDVPLLGGLLLFNLALIALHAVRVQALAAAEPRRPRARREEAVRAVGAPPRPQLKAVGDHRGGVGGRLVLRRNTRARVARRRVDGFGRIGHRIARGRRGSAFRRRGWKRCRARARRRTVERFGGLTRWR